jgi:glycosyltransferase involved in cell wall biosynthesis
MRILFLSGHLPSSTARQAGQRTSYHICEFLSRRHQVHLLAFANRDEMSTCNPEAMRIFASWEIVPITTAKRMAAVIRALRLPFAVATRWQRGFQEKVEQLLHTQEFDVAILDHTAMWQYAGTVSPVPLRGASAHDVLSQLWRRKAQNSKPPRAWILSREQKRLLRWERAVLQKLEFVAAHNQKDAQLLAEISPTTAQCPIQPWSSVDLTERAAQNVSRERNSIVFWGAMNRRENIDAVEFGTREILPKIAAEFPDFKFYVAGADSDKLLELKSLDPRIQLTGFVSDIAAFLSTKQIALLPLRLGAGIKVKTLECMAAGLAVVATSVGAEGIAGQHGRDYLIGDRVQELSAHVVRLLRSPELCADLGRNAQEVVRNEHGFERPMERLEEFLLERVARSATSSTSKV